MACVLCSLDMQDCCDAATMQPHALLLSALPCTIIALSLYSIYGSLHQPGLAAWEGAIMLLKAAACMQAAITSNGGAFSASLQSISDSSSSTDGSSTACKQHFGHWCIDHSRVSRGGIIAIIVCVGFFVLCLLVLIPVFALLARRRRRAAKP